MCPVCCVIDVPGLDLVELLREPDGLDGLDVVLGAEVNASPLLEFLQDDLGVDPRITDLTHQLLQTVDEEQRIAIARQIQETMDEDALLVPLYVPRRLALVRPCGASVTLDHDLYRLEISKTGALTRR